MKTILIVLTILFCSSLAYATNAVYLAQAATGANNGTDCADAKAYTYFNSSGNWSATPTGIQIGPGTTVHLCGTIGAGAGNTVLFVQGNGSNGSPVTILFEPGASIQAPYFVQGGAIQIYGYNYITINGGTNGFIESTLNGTSGGACPGGTCSDQQDSQAVYVFGNNDTIENLLIENMYVRTSTSDLGPSGLNDSCIEVGKGTDSQVANNLLITGNTCHDAGIGIDFQIGVSGSGYTASKNTIYNTNWAMDLIAYGGNYDSIYIFGNKAYNYTAWDNPGTDAFHHNAIHLFQGNSSSATLSHLYIYNNEFDGPVGDCCVTAQIYVDNNGTSMGFTTSYVFNNVFSWANGDCSGTCADGQLVISSGSGWAVYNNTFLGNTTSTSQQGSCLGFYSVASSTDKNGLFSACVNQVSTAASASFVAANPDYNLYSNSGGQAWEWMGTFYTQAQLSSWQTATGAEAHSAYFASSPIPTCNSNTDCSNVAPTAGSTALNFAVNLYSTCNGQAIPGLGALCSDKNGNPRPPTGPWTAGAIQVGASPPGVPPAVLLTGGATISGQGRIQ